MCRHRFRTQDSTSKTLDEVIVTANKFPQKQSETGKVVTIITQDNYKKVLGNLFQKF